MTRELGAHHRGPRTAANGADEHGFSAEQRMGDGGVQRGSAGRGMELTRVDLGVLLRQPVEPVENVEGAAAEEECARGLHGLRDFIVRKLASGGLRFVVFQVSEQGQRPLLRIESLGRPAI
jgi:hypothetical protein